MNRHPLDPLDPLVASAPRAEQRWDVPMTLDFGPVNTAAWRSRQCHRAKARSWTGCEKRQFLERFCISWYNISYCRSRKFFPHQPSPLSPKRQPFPSRTPLEGNHRKPFICSPHRTSHHALFVGGRGRLSQSVWAGRRAEFQPTRVTPFRVHLSPSWLEGLSSVPRSSI